MFLDFLLGSGTCYDGDMVELSRREYEKSVENARRKREERQAEAALANRRRAAEAKRRAEREVREKAVREQRRQKLAEVQTVLARETEHWSQMEKKARAAVSDSQAKLKELGEIDQALNELMRKNA